MVSAGKMATRISFAAVALSAIVAATLLQSTAAATYVVGDTIGWSVPSSGASAYTNWASQHNFTVGDILIFNFLTGQHDLARVSKGNFDACNATGPISLQTTGPANFTLNSTGEFYFICTFDQHCSQGQKLSINVTSNSITPSPPSSSPSPAPSPTPTPTPPPPPPSPTPTPTPTPSPPAPSPTPTPTPSPPAPSPTPSPPPQSPSSPAPSPGGSTSPPPSPPPPTPGSSPSPTTTPPSETTPPPPPPSSAPPKAVVATFALISMTIAAVGVLF